MTPRSTRFAVAFLGASALLAAGCSANSDANRQAAGSGQIAAFTLMAPTSVTPSQLVARAIVSTGTPCPSVNAVGASGPTTIPMTSRLPGPLAAPAFATVLACSANLPVGLTSATIGGASIPAALPSSISSLGIVADSGCEVDPPDVQDCKSSTAWPLAANAAQIVKAKPDVILDPGDYNYREAACPADAQAKCGGSPPPVPGMPFYESSDNWMADVIKPMSAMFPVAPLAMLRGNHEDCGRAGNGFFLYLDPRPDTAQTCEPVLAKPAKGSTANASPGGTSAALAAPPPQLTPTWAFTLPISAGRQLRVAMVDTAYGSDKQLTSWTTQQRKGYVQAAALTQQTPGRESWLMAHRPTFALMSNTQLSPTDPQETAWTSDGQMVSSHGLLGNYAMMLTAHLHLAQAVQIPGQPASLVMGNGGANLEPEKGYVIPKVGPLANADGTPMVANLRPYPNASSFWNQVQFGFAVAKPTASPGAWSIDQFASSGESIGRCSLANRTISCT